ncbi:hypothetical protein [Fusibacter tunisiensis]|uniref:Uncharacterized protein n=1 Tax=Fusibacter tunisiensis TaxID=1008308 RepID=A0ABS2MUE4_9FIRM|nr:hypothetical protein [Fusibacter tunisiensis]MBM7563029.1 hypothetical protein [Fusibacter tunisiensis]
MIFLRMGTRILFLRSEAPDSTCTLLSEKFAYETVTMEVAKSCTDNNSTVLFITEKNLVITDTNDAKYIMLARKSSSSVLADLFNCDMKCNISKVDIGPKIILFRLPSENLKIKELLEKEFNGRSMNWQEAVKLGEQNHTILSLTTKPLHPSPLPFSGHILVDMPLHKCYARLQREALMYVTHTLEEENWYDYEINLYDLDDHFEIHFQRLAQVISGLELGLVLGEGWTRDFAHVLMSLMVYQVRLFSLMPPIELKKILMGLEYLEDGTRLADFDLFYKRKKIAWTEVQKHASLKNNKMDEGILRRNQLMAMLPEAEKKTILNLDSRLK